MYGKMSTKTNTIQAEMHKKTILIPWILKCDRNVTHKLPLWAFIHQRETEILLLLQYEKGYKYVKLQKFYLVPPPSMVRIRIPQPFTGSV